MRKNEGTITVRTIYITLGYQYAPPTRVRLSFWVNTGLCLLAGVIAQPVAVAQQIVTNARPAAQVLAAAAERRVDIALIGDSTTVYAGHGWDHGFSYACDQRFGLYATGIHSAGENAGQGGGIGYYSRTMHSNGATTGTFQYGGATGPQGDALGPTFAPQHYLFAPPGRAGRRDRPARTAGDDLAATRPAQVGCRCTRHPGRNGVLPPAVVSAPVARTSIRAYPASCLTSFAVAAIFLTTSRLPLDGRKVFPSEANRAPPHQTAPAIATDSSVGLAPVARFGYPPPGGPSFRGSYWPRILIRLRPTPLDGQQSPV